MKFLSEPPTAALFFCGEIETSRLKFSSEIKNFDRDQKFRSGSNFFDRWALWDREKLTVKKTIIKNEMFFSPFMSLINREKLCVNREKSAPKIHHFFHR